MLQRVTFGTGVFIFFHIICEIFSLVAFLGFLISVLTLWNEAGYAVFFGFEHIISVMIPGIGEFSDFIHFKKFLSGFSHFCKLSFV